MRDDARAARKAKTKPLCDCRKAQNHLCHRERCADANAGAAAEWEVTKARE
jgi:hypothetical protein